jgi:hypothetical protein
MLSAMTAPQARAPQTPNHKILILTSSNFNQLAKSTEESFSHRSRRSGESANRASNQRSHLQIIFYSPPQHRPDSNPQPETITEISKQPILSQVMPESGRCSLIGSLTPLEPQIISVMLLMSLLFDSRSLARAAAAGRGGEARIPLDFC